MNIAQLLKTKDVQLVMFEFTSMYKPSMTSEEFLKSTVLQMRVGAFLGRKAGNALGFRSVSRENFTFPHNVTTTGVAFVCSLIANGIEIEDIEQSTTGDTCVVNGIVPSSLLHFGGKITVEVSTHHSGTNVLVGVVYPGQLIAWGAGKRLFANLRSTLDRAVVRVRQCPSLSVC